MLNPSELKKIDAYWRASNYLAAGQLYLLDNPMLRRPLTRDDVKKKIVGHWGTVPGQNFVYVHLNRVIKKYDQDMILISGPGHGGNFFVANAYLDGTYCLFLYHPFDVVVVCLQIRIAEVRVYPLLVVSG